MVEEFLTEQQRKQYQKELNDQQLETLNEYKRLRFNSLVLTKINQTGSKWQLVKELIYEKFDRHNPLASPYICACGKHVKYLYICQSTSTNETKNFGYKHLEDEAGIPKKIIRQVNQLHHKIDKGLDIILSYYHEGYRFPKGLFDFAEKHMWLNSDHFTRNELRYMMAFRKANLPLYQREFSLLKALKDDYDSEKDRLKQIKQDYFQRKKEKAEEQKRQKEARKALIAAKKLADKRRKEEAAREKEVKKLLATGEYTEEGSYDLEEKMKKTFRKVFQFSFDRIEENGIYFNSMSDRLAVYCIYNMGDFERGQRINNYQQAAKRAHDLLIIHPGLKSDLLSSNQIYTNLDKQMANIIFAIYKVLYFRLHLIGKDEAGHPIALNKIHFI